MRHLLSVSPLLLLFGVAASASAQALPRMGYVDSRQIIAESGEAKAAQDQFERDMARYRNEVQQMGQELQTLVGQYEQQQLTLSPDAKQARESEIRTKQGTYEARVVELENQAAQRQSELVEPVMQKINDIIESIRTEGNYVLIFDVAAQSILAADPALDLTQEVIRRLATQQER